jgi:mono/diheme cytochrome c family protein
MVFNYLGLILLLSLTVLFAILAVRSFRSKGSLVRWGGLFLSSLMTLSFSLASIFVIIGLYKYWAVIDIPTPDIQVAGTPEQIARGEHLANSFCTSCHSLNGELPLTGGLDLADDLAIPLGSFVSVNLTPAGPLAGWSDGEIFRALRNGVNREGRKLIIMSSVRARNMSDEDIMALIAFLRNQPAIPFDTPYPPDRPNLLALIMSGASLIPEGLPPILGSITAPPKAATVEYGDYIIGYQDCRDCHGEDLKGGLEGQLGPIGPNLSAVKGWTSDQFITAMRTGITPSGDPIDPPMPWQSIGRMDNEELTAMHLYIQSLP